MAERLEDRRLLTVTYTIERHDVEGSRVGIYAEFVADAPPTSADVDYGDGTASSLWVDYDANTHTGSVTGLHDYAAPGSYDISTSLRDDDSADSRTFQVTIAEGTCLAPPPHPVARAT
jgi:hypothetical protein